MAKRPCDLDCARPVYEQEIARYGVFFEGIDPRPPSRDQRSVRRKDVLFDLDRWIEKPVPVFARGRNARYAGRRLDTLPAPATRDSHDSCARVRPKFSSISKSFFYLHRAGRVLRPARRRRWFPGPSHQLVPAMRAKMRMPSQPTVNGRVEARHHGRALPWFGERAFRGPARGCRGAGAPGHLIRSKAAPVQSPGSGCRGCPCGRRVRSSGPAESRRALWHRVRAPVERAPLGYPRKNAVHKDASLSRPPPRYLPAGR